MDNDLEFPFVEHRQLIHRCFDGAHRQPALAGDLTIEFQLRAAEIHDCHIGSGGCVQRTVPTAARCQAEQALATHSVGQPSVAVEHAQRIGKLFVVRRARKSLPLPSKL
jgi:hypothetical protein